MSEDVLIALADKYNIPHLHGYGATETDIANRDEVIAALVARDNARRAGTAQVVSILAIIIALAALAVSIFKK